MRRVSINGVSYAAPFERRLPPHTAQQHAALAADILARRRVLLPVVTYLSPAHGRAVLDGVTRATVAAEHDIGDVPVDDWGEVPDDAALAACLALNAARRQISARDYEEVVVTMRKAGETIRDIAAACALPRGRVVRIVEGAGLPSYPLAPALWDEEPDDDEPAPAEVPSAPEPPLAMPRPADIVEVTFADNLKKMQAALTTAAHRAGALLRSSDPRRERLRAAARRLGVPLGRGESWPALEALREALEAVAGAEGKAA